MIVRNKHILSILFFALVISTACSDDSTSVDENGAVINGSVEGDFSQAKDAQSESNTEGTMVWAGNISSNGSISKIGETETEVDASGNFTLILDGSHSGDLAIVAENEGNQMTGFISADLESGSSYTVKPINSESTAQTLIYADIVADGNADIVHKSDIEMVVRTNSAAAIHSSSSVAEEVAVSIQNSADARAEFLADMGSEGDAEAQISEYFRLMTDIQFEYEMALSNASSDEARQAAFETFIDSQFNAYTEAETNLNTIAKMLHMQKHVLIESMNSVSAGVKNEGRASKALITAIAIDAAVQSRAEATGLSETTISAIADAGSSLRADVQGSSGAETEISAAFETYHDSVRVAIENDDSTEASVIVAIDTELNAVGGAKLLFDSAISGIIGTTTLVDAYIEFESNVHSTVETQGALVGDVDIEALADVFVLINLS